MGQLICKMCLCAQALSTASAASNTSCKCYDIKQFFLENFVFPCTISLRFGISKPLEPAAELTQYA